MDGAFAWAATSALLGLFLVISLWQRKLDKEQTRQALEELSEARRRL